MVVVAAGDRLGPMGCGHLVVSALPASEACPVADSSEFHGSLRSSVSCRLSVSGDDGQLCVEGAADLMRGDGPYASPAIGLASGLPALARFGPSRGFPCQFRRGSGDPSALRPKESFAFAPADRRWPGRSGSDGQGAEAAARAALWGRLEQALI